jgi:hypothetical protein
MRSTSVFLSSSLLALALAPLSAGAAADRGRFVVQAPYVETAEGRTAAREMQESGALETMAEALNSVLVLPADIGLRYAECGEANAYYDPEERRISMCLELMEGMAETLEGQFEDEDATAEALAGAFLAVLLHEAGHALVDVLELPVTGREEDAVDQLSAWLLIEAEDVESVLGAAASYYTEEGEAGDDEFADEHSLDRQRYFNLVCWAYGSNPDESEDLVETWELPEARAERCAEEYAQLDRSWSRLLGPHLRDDAGETTRTVEREPAPRRPAPGRDEDEEADEAAPLGKVGKFQPIEADDG